MSADELKRAGRVAGSSGQGTTAAALDVFLTRLHVRYDGAHFPEDLVFQETADRENFQGRYVLRHPWKGDTNCPGGVEYRRAVFERQQREVENLASLTGWSVDDVRRRTGIAESRPPQVTPAQKSWWQRMWDW